MYKILWLLILLLTKATKQKIKNGVYNIILNEKYFLNYKKKNFKFLLPQNLKKNQILESINYLIILFI